MPNIQEIWNKEGDCLKQGQTNKVWVPKSRSVEPSASVQPHIPSSQPHDEVSTLPDRQANKQSTPVRKDPQVQGLSNRSPGNKDSNNTQGSWQKVVSHRPGKDPVVVEDHEMSCQYAQQVSVGQVRGRVEGYLIVVQHPIIPNG